MSAVSPRQRPHSPGSAFVFPAKSPNERPSTATFEKTISLFTDPHYSSLISRQSNGIDQLCRKMSNGYFISDLDYVVSIIGYAVKKLESKEEESSKFIQSLNRLVSISMKPFHVERTSDMQRNKQKIISFISCLGELLHITELQTEVLKVLFKYSTVEQLGDEHHYTTTLLQSLHESGVAKQVYELFVSEGKRGYKDEELLILLLNTIKQLSYYHSQVLLLPQELVSSIIQLLERGESVGRLVLEIFWNMIELDDAQLEKIPIGILLRSLITTLITSMYKAEEREYCHEIFTISILIAKHESSHRFFISSKYIDHIVTLSTNETQHEPDPLLVPLEVEFETKQLLLTLLGCLLPNAECRKKIIQGGFMEVALLYLSTEETDNEVIKRWKPNQLSTIRKQICSIIFNNITLCHAEFAELGGPEVLFRWIDAGNDVDMRDCATILLCNYCSVPNVKLNTENKVSIVLDMMKDSLPDNTVCDAISLLSFFCRESEFNRDIFINNGGLNLLLPLLKTFLSRRDRSSTAEHLIVSIVDCIWSCIDHLTVNEFIEKDGVDLLIDLVESCTVVNIQNQVLGCLSDLCEHDDVVKKIKLWKSEHSNTRITKLLVTLWTKEEMRLGVLTENGTLADPSRPLSRVSSSRRSRANSSSKKSDTDLRTTIYALFCKLGIDKEAKELNALEKGKLDLIDNFLQFRVAEVWKDISEELESESVQPINADWKIIEKILGNSQEKALEVKQRQEKLLAEEMELQLREEKTAYESITHHHLMNQRAQLHLNR